MKRRCEVWFVSHQIEPLHENRHTHTHQLCLFPASFNVCVLCPSIGITHIWVTESSSVHQRKQTASDAEQHSRHGGIQSGAVPTGLSQSQILLTHQERHGWVNPTGTQVGKEFLIQGQAIVHNAGNVLAHPGRYLHCKQLWQRSPNNSKINFGLFSPTSP